MMRQACELFKISLGVLTKNRAETGQNLNIMARTEAESVCMPMKKISCQSSDGQDFPKLWA